MANCKECAHWNKCATPDNTTRYYGKSIVADNVEKRCNWFITELDILPKNKILKIKTAVVDKIFEEFLIIYRKHYHDYDKVDRKLKKEYWDYEGSAMQGIYQAMEMASRSTLNDMYNDFSAAIKDYLGE